MNKTAIGVIIALVLASLWYIERASAIRSAERAVQAVEDKKRAEDIALVEKTNRELVEQSQAMLKDKENDIKNLNIVVNDLTQLLRNRPSRETVATGACAPATGAELYREDAEFLVGEAARAERIRIERDDYYRQYEAARQKLATR